MRLEDAAGRRRAAVAALSGDGVIDFASLTRAVEATGYDRDIEVEIFNEEIWATEPFEAVRRTAVGFAAAVSPHLLESRS